MFKTLNDELENVSISHVITKAPCSGGAFRKNSGRASTASSVRSNETRFSRGPLRSRRVFGFYDSRAITRWPRQYTTYYTPSTPDVKTIGRLAVVEKARRRQRRFGSISRVRRDCSGVYCTPPRRGIIVNSDLSRFYQKNNNRITRRAFLSARARYAPPSRASRKNESTLMETL